MHLKTPGAPEPNLVSRYIHLRFLFVLVRRVRLQRELLPHASGVGAHSQVSTHICGSALVNQSPNPKRAAPIRITFGEP